MNDTTKSDPEVAVVARASGWRALLKAVPVGDETYTPEGESIFAVVQAIEQAVEEA